MPKYTGAEGRIVPNEESDKWIADFEKEFGGSKFYTKFEVLGKDVISALAVKGAVAGKICYGIRDGQLCMVVKPVNQYGKELLVTASVGGMKDDPGSGGGGSGPRCPPSC